MLLANSFPTMLDVIKEIILAVHNPNTEIKLNSDRALA